MNKFDLVSILACMPRDWESSFSSWAQAPGKTEQAKCDNAERAIRKAIDASELLSSRSVSVFPQGSYRNRTNVRTESDVDIAIRSRETFFFKLPEGAQAKDFGITPATYTFAQYKADVHNALSDYLGSNAVTPGKKAFDIHENTYRIDADALACFEYRRYWTDGTHTEGVAFISDDGNLVANYPDLNYENGVAKNKATGYRFKAVVRILKALRSEMASNQIPIAAKTSSFLIECLVWNVPNEGFGHDTFRADVRYALAHLWNQTRPSESCSDWREVNGIKYLFHSLQPWTLADAHAFLDAAWKYVGFE
jgi:hypothetical protein